MRATLNLFSGRPNPSWRLNASDASELVDRVTAGVPVVAGEAPRLGFRGVTLEAELDDVARRRPLPARFVVPPAAATEAGVAAPERKGGRRATAARESAPAPARDASRWLLTTAAGAVPDDVLEAASAAMSADTPVEPQQHALASVDAAQGDSPSLDLDTCEPFLTPIVPAFWSAPAVQFRNNCYNYAANFVSNTLAQPGRRAGRPYTGFVCGSVAAAARFDGCLPDCRGSVRVIALAIWPGFDFHWWRLHPNGFWAHKIGTSPVLQIDNRGRVIGNGLSPATCDRGPYTQFCAFFYAPLGLEVL
jgi:hypothetical protein